MSIFSQKKLNNSNASLASNQEAESPATGKLSVRAASAFGQKPENKTEDVRPSFGPLGFRGELMVRFSVSDDGQDYLILNEENVLEIEGKPGAPINGWFTRLDNGYRYHYQLGKWHHDTGPACILPDGRGFIHYRFGKMHKDDGYALELVTENGDHRKARFVNGQKHAEKEASSITIRADGSQVICWEQHGLLSREDGPALTAINPEGEIVIEEYYLGGQLHRLDGPAVIMKNRMEWRQENELHRLDGPALIVNGVEEYYIQGRSSDRSAASKAYIENRSQTIGKAKKSEIIEGDTEDKRRIMLSNITNWKKDKERAASAPRKGPKP
ncbi:hypothetical protein [Methylotenera sp.]|uniref:hypothetical protein n=1 Tax=Methylotenera sp. TaxID=2051956 RepID=UPI0025E3D03C|nr:hypothetical protein [Methylotenera sp.]